MREPYILFRRPDGIEKGKMYYAELGSVPSNGGKRAKGLPLSDDKTGA